jgi:hypothetical protein
MAKNDKYTLNELVTAFEATKIFCDPRWIADETDKKKIEEYHTMYNLNFKLRTEIYNKLLEYDV